MTKAHPRHNFSKAQNPLRPAGKEVLSSPGIALVSSQILFRFSSTSPPTPLASLQTPDPAFYSLLFHSRPTSLFSPFLKDNFLLCAPEAAQVHPRWSLTATAANALTWALVP